jgi:hypothetical protein
MTWESSNYNLHFFEKGVPVSASIDAYGFLLKILKYPHIDAFLGKLSTGSITGEPPKIPLVAKYTIRLVV